MFQSNLMKSILLVIVVLVGFIMSITIASAESQSVYSSTGTLTDTTGLQFDNFIISSSSASDNSWVKIQIKDRSGTELLNKIINKGKIEYFPDFGFSIKALDIKAGSDGKMVSTDIEVSYMLKKDSGTAYSNGGFRF